MDRSGSTPRPCDGGAVVTLLALVALVTQLFAPFQAQMSTAAAQEADVTPPVVTVPANVTAAADSSGTGRRLRRS